MASRTPSSNPSRSASRSVSSTSLPTRASTPVVDLSPAEKHKEALIRTACRNRDITTLVHLATSSSGLISDSLRCTAWPLLLGCTQHDADQQPPWKELPTHKDEHQVGLDVNRAFVYYPKNESEKQLDRRKEDLSNVILEVLRRHPSLCYFQGYHDIVQVLLLVLGPQDAPAAVARLSLLRIRDFMLSSLDPAISQLKLLSPIFRAADPELYQHLSHSQPSFALANTITMFAHNIQEYKHITRLFDFFLAHDAVMPIYLFASVVLSRKEELLDIEKEDEDILHVMLGKLPEPFDLEFHIARTMELYERLPPASLGSWEWWGISSSSVLKTSATALGLNHSTLKDGEKYFAQQEKEVQRQQALRRVQTKALHIRKTLWYHRQYGYFGLALIVGAYALMLGRNSNLSTRLPFFGSLGDFLRRLSGLIA